MDDLLQKQQKNTTGKFKIYRSSAGSGKTFTLTKEYLKLALATPGNENFSPFYFRHILAVTFTNDAAKEMKERILGNLSSIAHLPEGEKYDMLNLILEELQEEYPQLKLDADELKRRAALLHETILHRYTDFSVSTIDAFSNRVVQSFKKDLNLPYNYDIVLEVDELLEEAADLLQDQIGTEEGKEISNLLVEFALNKAEEESSWYIDEALKEFGKQLFIEDRLAHIESISELMPASFKQIISKIYQYLKKVDSDLIGLGRSALDLIKANSIRPEAFARGKQGIAGFFAKAASSSAILSELNLSNSYILKTIEDDKWTSGKADAAEKAAIESIKGTLMALYYRIVALAEAEKGNYIIINSLKKNIYLIATINELGRKVSEIKAEKHQVHIADFNQKINQIVEEEPVPYIYERLGDRYKHILIDEFQDTSRMQWHNLIPLVLNALGLNMANLVVGDAKQAIYRWRGGKADMLVSLPDIPTAPPESVIAQEAVAFKLHQQALSLSTNRRSKDDIINFNNLFFETLKTRFSLQYPSLKDFYEDVEQACNNKPGGLIKLEFIQSGIARSLFEAATFNRVLTQINELVASGIYQHADIAILVRNNRAGAFLAEKLMEHNIHVVSDESLLLHNSPIIKFITGFLSVIAFPVNPVLKMELIEFLDQHYQKIIPGGKVLNGIVYNQLGEILKQHDLFQFFEWLNEFFGATLQVRGIQFRTLYEMTEELIRQFQLYYEVPQQVYLQKFLDIVLSFSTRKGNSLIDFLDYWKNQEGRISVSSPEKSNAVRIMTIHKSKGLQFPVVILPFANWSINPKAGEQKWFNWQHPSISDDLYSVILPIKKDLENTDLADEYSLEKEQIFLDAINILYVGFTRPESALIVISEEKDLSKPGSSIADILYGFAEQETDNSEKEVIEIDVAVNLSFVSQVNIKSFMPFGQPETDLNEKRKTVSKQSAFHPYLLKKFIHTANSDKIRMRKNTLRYNESNISLDDIFSSRKAGILMHYAFEKVKYKEDIPTAVKELVTEGLISTSLAEEYEQKMFEVTNLPEIATYFEKNESLLVKNEKEVIVTRKGKAGASLRPDRIVRLNDELIIIDYKTGKENEEKYARQIRGYARAFKNMGYKKIKMFIVYTELLQAVKIN